MVEYHNEGTHPVIWWVKEWQRLKSEVDSYYQAMQKLLSSFDYPEDCKQNPAYILLENKLKEVKSELLILESVRVEPSVPDF